MPLNIAVNSSEIGYLAPTADQVPVADIEFDNFFQQLVANVCNVTPRMVRPRWQKDPPNDPNIDDDWISVGYTSTPAIGMYDVVEHDPTGLGSDNVFHHEDIELIVSFIGPNAGKIALLFRMGMSVAQNREALTLAQMGLTNVGDPLRVPSLFKNQWRNQIDVHVFLRRVVVLNYPVNNLESIPVTVTTG